MYIIASGIPPFILCRTYHSQSLLLHSRSSNIRILPISFDFQRSIHACCFFFGGARCGWGFCDGLRHVVLQSCMSTDDMYAPSTKNIHLDRCPRSFLSLLILSLRDHIDSDEYNQFHINNDEVFFDWPIQAPRCATKNLIRTLILARYCSQLTARDLVRPWVWYLSASMYCGNRTIVIFLHDNHYAESY